MYLLVLVHLVFSPVPQVQHMEIISFHSGKQDCIKDLKARREKVGKDWPDQLNIGCIPLNMERT